MAPKEPVGDFYVNVLRGDTSSQKKLVSSTKLLTQSGKPSVISFYDGGWGGCRPCQAKMELWGSEFSEVQFFSVCVDTLGVAKQFDQMFGFKGAVNCHIPSREYFPVGYGQLGCSGFIVADKHGNFVSRKTKAYLQYGDGAFLHVEELLREQLQQEDGNPPVRTNKISRTTDSVVTPSSRAESKEEKKDSDSDSEVEPEPVPSVGVESMDQEHERCEAALALFQRTKSVQALETLMGELLKHFRHEEDLMKAHNFGNAIDNEDAFSAFKSHCKDHELILDIGFRALGNAAGYSPKVSSKSTDCASEGGAWHRPSRDVETVDPSVYKDLVEAFTTHAKFFDILYSGAIPASAK